MSWSAFSHHWECCRAERVVAFAQFVESIARPLAFEGLAKSGCPANLYFVELRSIAQAKVEARVARGEVTASALPVLQQRGRASLEPDSRPNSVAVRLHADELERYEMVAVGGGIV